jgi:hypothetical protein
VVIGNSATLGLSFMYIMTNLPLTENRRALLLAIKSLGRLGSVKPIRSQSDKGILVAQGKVEVWENLNIESRSVRPEPRQKDSKGLTG